MLIIGAGMSGLLAGQYFRSHSPRIIENQNELPNNHSALLRFRTSKVSDLTGIRFKKVKVQKAIWSGTLRNESNIALNNKYSKKVTGVISDRSSLDLSPAERFIAPPDFIQRLSKGLSIAYNRDARCIIPHADKMPTISTMPVKQLALMLDYELKADLITRSIHTVGFTIPNCNIHQTIYYPDPVVPLYRLSVTGDRAIAEYIVDPMMALEDTQVEDILCQNMYTQFGISIDVEMDYKKEQKYGKLVPCNGREVKDFIGWATREHNIYSLGRWATHRQLLMDDVVDDIKVIDNMIHSNNYER